MHCNFRTLRIYFEVQCQTNACWSTVNLRVYAGVVMTSNVRDKCEADLCQIAGHGSNLKKKKIIDQNQQYRDIVVNMIRPW